MKKQRRVGAPPDNRNSVKHHRYGRELLEREAQVRNLIRRYTDFLEKLALKGGD